MKRSTITKTVCAGLAAAALVFTVNTGAQISGNPWRITEQAKDLLDAAKNTELSLADDNNVVSGTGEENQKWCLSCQAGLETTPDTSRIDTPDDLAMFARVVNGMPGIPGNSFKGKVVVLNNNLNMASYGQNFNNGRGWKPMGQAIPFAGTFEGNGKTIHGLYINDPAAATAGLFGKIADGATVKNTGVGNANITGSGNMGGIAGTTQNSSIENCYFTGTINGTPFENTYLIGGITGTVQNGGKVTNCYSSGTINGSGGSVTNSGVGGIAGTAYKGSITNSYSRAAVNNAENSDNSSAGGIAGVAIGAATITHCAALNPSVTGGTNTTKGRVTGLDYHYDGDNTIENNAAFQDMNGTFNGTAGENGTNITIEQIKNDGTIGERFANADVWTTQNGKLPGLFGKTEELPIHLGGTMGYFTATVTRGIGSGQFEAGSIVTITADAPETGYEFSSWTANTDVKFGNRNNRNTTFTMPANDVTITANYKTTGTTTPPNNTYTVTVNGGTGGGQYQRGATVNIRANTPPAGQEFDNWTTTSAGVNFANANSAQTSFTMPGNNVTVRANFKTETVTPPDSNVVGGTGNPNTEWYTANPAANTFYIRNADEMAGFAGLVNEGNVFENKTVVLANNIDISAYGEGFNDGKGWIPIGNGSRQLRGTFDGGGKTISGLYINDTDTDGSEGFGLFGVVSPLGTVKNFGVVDMNITVGQGYVGGVAGIFYGVNLTNCYSTGTIRSDYVVGGIVGGGVVGSINNCYSTSTVIGGNAGGIAGSLSSGNGSVTACYSTGAINGRSGGGLVGYTTRSEIEIKNNAALNPSVIVADYEVSGRVIGRVYYGENPALKESNIAFSGMVGAFSDLDAAENGTDISAETIRADGTLGGRFTAANGWTTQNGRLPGLFGQTVEMPAHLGGSVVPPPPPSDAVPMSQYESYPDAATYSISTADEMAKFAEIVNGDEYFRGKTVTLVNDIDLSAYGETFNDGKGWIPIGNIKNNGVSVSPFAGVFNGNEKTVRGLYINDKDTTMGNIHGYHGLFGSVQGTVKNLGVVGVNITVGRSSDVGGVVAIAGGSVENCYSTGTVIGSHGYITLGGVVARLSANGNITNCYSACTLGNADGVALQAIGGVVGDITQGGSVANSYFIGDFSFSGTATATISGGGIVGLVVMGNVINCVALNSGPLPYIDMPSRVGRVVGYYRDELVVTISNNIAFSGMTGNFGSSTANQNGADITPAEIHADGTLGGRFTAAGGWTTQNGRLPGLFGQTVEMPEHLRLSSSPPVSPAPSPSSSDVFTAGPNPVDRFSGGIGFYYDAVSGGLVLQKSAAGSVAPVRLPSGVLTVYDAAGNVVRKLKITGRVGGLLSPAVSRHQICSWDLKDARGRPVPEGTYVVRGVLKSSGGSKRAVSLVVGVR